MNTDLEATVPALQILGGGPGGLAAAYYACKRGFDLALYEGAKFVGGNARTCQLGECFFDTGAHRVHDKLPEVTQELRSLLGADLLSVNAPSKIYLAGKWLRFPLQPGDLLRQLECRVLARIVFERLVVRRNPEANNFKDWAVGQYGPTLAGLVLLNYSEKLWGEKVERLSPKVAGGRLRNLDLWAFLRGIFPGDDRRHLDGKFLYPKYGFGSIFERVSEEIGFEAIHCGCRVTRLLHRGGRIEAIEFNGTTKRSAHTLISSLPLTLTMDILDPKPPAELVQTARSIRFRKLLLCVFCLKRPRFSDNASIYFPDPVVPFTRLYECKNRSPHMAPPDQTAIVLEIPCHDTNSLWSMDETSVLDRVFAALNEVVCIEKEEVLQSAIYRLPFAYPILEVGVEDKVGTLTDYLASFENFHLLGRNATFDYLHTHDLFDEAKKLVDAIDI